jgi:hypothetical protein
MLQEYTQWTSFSQFLAMLMDFSQYNVTLLDIVDDVVCCKSESSSLLYEHFLKSWFYLIYIEQ